jgi:ribosomal RNA assembly protein
MKDEKMKDENWDKYLPKFKQVKMTKKKNKKVREKKAKTPFPPEQTPRIEDIKMETGEYFLSERERKISKLEVKKKKQEEKRREMEIEREVEDDEQEQLDQ